MDITTNELPAPAGTPDPTAERIEDLCRQHQVLRQEALDAKAQVQDIRRQFYGVRESLQEAIDQLDTDDGEGGFADELVEFLNANTPWEFKLEKTYRVEIRGWVTVEARSEYDATNTVENSNWSFEDSEIEPESFEVRKAELA
jgi:hypothetical protein